MGRHSRQRAFALHHAAGIHHAPPCNPRVLKHIDGGESDKDRKMLSVRKGKCKILKGLSNFKFYITELKVFRFRDAYLVRMDVSPTVFLLSRMTLEQHQQGFVNFGENTLFFAKQLF